MSQALFLFFSFTPWFKRNRRENCWWLDIKKKDSFSKLLFIHLQESTASWEHTSYYNKVLLLNPLLLNIQLSKPDWTIKSCQHEDISITHGPTSPYDKHRMLQDGAQVKRVLEVDQLVQMECSWSMDIISDAPSQQIFGTSAYSGQFWCRSREENSRWLKNTSPYPTAQMSETTIALYTPIKTWPWNPKVPWGFSDSN